MKKVNMFQALFKPAYIASNRRWAIAQRGTLAPAWYQSKEQLTPAGEWAFRTVATHEDDMYIVVRPADWLKIVGVFDETGGTR